MARAHSGRDSALSPAVRLGTEAEAQEGPRRMQLAPCKAGILALLQPLRLLLPPAGMWGWQWAVPATLLRSLLTPDSREYDGQAPTSHFVCRHNVLQAPAVVKRDGETGSLPGGSSSATTDLLLGGTGLRVCCSLLPALLS